MSSAAGIELQFAGTMSAFESSFEDLRNGLERFALGSRARYAVELVFDEIVSNIVRYSGRTPGSTTVWVSLGLVEQEIRLTFEDDGVPFDPLSRTDPTPATDLESTPVGGRGIMLVRRVVSAMEYSRTPEQRNRLVVTLPRAVA